MNIVRRGYVLGDHSYDHMSHNVQNGLPKYVDHEVDAQYFGAMNIDPILELLANNGFAQEDIDKVEDSMYKYARLPYTNHWRLEGRFV